MGVSHFFYEKGQGGKEAKTLLLKLRGSYRDTRRRQMKYVKRRAAPESIKPWILQKQMTFIYPFILTRLQEGNISDSDDDAQLLTPVGDEILDNEEIEEGSSHQRERRERAEAVENSDNSSRRAEFSPLDVANLTSVMRNKTTTKRK
ncbi:hypothetical protein HHI36_008826 [Cryptolaemus montrouzieri]|uniref:Uncharacterized protein n=1 Tax=Cryptolaemus montrouzieri TaxID=559131 RepID=A0ABD2MTM7_9CUCU